MLSRYKRNNILFRIASADAISKFKATQAQSFVQLARKELAFDMSAKEVVLLEFDRFSHWIFTIERIFITIGEKYVPPHLRDTVFELFVNELNVIESVMECHREVFTEEVREFTKLIHKYISDLLHVSLEEALVLKADTAFVEIVKQVSTYLQHLLVAMHEFNNNIITKAESPFLSAANFCVSNISHPNFGPCLIRARFFINHGVENSFLFKNYATSELYSQAHRFLSKNNVNLILEENSEIT